MRKSDAMKPRIAVIGQSNAILSTGFVHKLAAIEGLEIGNMARLGASPSILLPFFATPTFFAGHDFAIFDLAIIDQGFLWAGALDPYSIVRWLEYGIHQAHAAGCIPILLVIPHRAVIPPGGLADQVPLLQQLYRSVALHNDAVCFDLFESMCALARQSPAALDDAYADNDHLSQGFSALVAEHLTAFVDRFPRNSLATRTITVAQPVMERLRLAESWTGNRIVRRESALLSSDFCVIAPGEIMALSTGPVARIHGALINRAGCTGMLRLDGSETMIKGLGTLRDSDHDFVAQAVSFLSTVHDGDGMVTLRIPDSIHTPTEPSWQAADEPEKALEIAELLVERATHPFSYPRPFLPLACRVVA